MGECFSDSDLEMEVCTPPELREAATNASADLLPDKSKKMYMNAYSQFRTWCEKKKAVKITENVLLAYFKEQADCKKVSTLWANYSMLKSTLAIKENTDISKFFKLKAFLKQKNNAYKPKKSRVFTKEEIDKFVTEAPDDEYLSKKAIVVIGMAGACRTDEMCNMVLDDLDIRDDIIVISIPNSKNGTSRKFVIVEQQWTNVIKKYLANRPTDIKKLFILYRGGKHIRQNIGHNTISKTPYIMAKYLKLQNPECYTGHSLRRSSATLLAENGGDLLSLKRHGGWKSAAVAEGYIEESIADKKRIAKLVQKSSLSNKNVCGPSTSSGSKECQDTAVESCQDDIVPSVDENLQNTKNVDVNLPLPNNVNSLHTGNTGMHIIYNNCTINYNFK